MTVTVTVKHKSGDHKDVLVETYDPVTGALGYNAKRLKTGDEMDITLYDSCSLRVSEIPKTV